MFKHNGRSVQTFGLLVFLALIIGVSAALARTGGASPGAASRAGASAALDSPLPPPAVPEATADAPIPLPHPYFPTRIPAEQRAHIQPQWVTYEVPGEGLTFRARKDWSVGKSRTSTRYSVIELAFTGTSGGIAFMQADNPQQLSLEEFAKTPVTAISSSHSDKWLAADIGTFARDVSNAHHKRLLITRDDSGQDVTASINGESQYVVLIAQDSRVVIASSYISMNSEAEQYFWEVIDSLTFTSLP